MLWKFSTGIQEKSQIEETFHLEKGNYMRFKGDIIITDPCYICKDDDWSKCGYGDNMGRLGIKNYI